MHLIEGNVVAPLIMQRGVHLPPVFSIMAVLIAGTLLGPLGLLVAVPSLGVVMVLLRKVLIERVYGDVATREAGASGRRTRARAREVRAAATRTELVTGAARGDSVARALGW